MSDDNVIPFGKYKGQPVEVLQADDNYRERLLNQPWLKDKFPLIQQLIINNFQEPTETPEHNKLQVKFLDEAFVTEFLRAAGLWERPEEIQAINPAYTKWEALDGKVRKVIQQLEDERGKIPVWRSETSDKEKKAVERLDAKIEKAKSKLTYTHPTYYIDRPPTDEEWKGMQERWIEGREVQFEEGGFDVTIRDDGNIIGVEVKPSLGDDYPAVLRQIKSAKIMAPRCPNNPRNNEMMDIVYDRVVLVDKFSAVGATLKQVKNIFHASKITLLTFADIGDPK